MPERHAYSNDVIFSSPLVIISPEYNDVRLSRMYDPYEVPEAKVPARVFLEAFAAVQLNCFERLLAGTESSG